VPNRIDLPDRPDLDLSVPARLARLVPGVTLCAAVTMIAVGLQAVEEASVGHPYIEAIVMAILLGTAIRTLWEPDPRYRAGIAFSAKQMLELAVALLGASITFSAIAASGVTLLAAIVTVVLLTLAASFAISRSLGLSVRLSILIACGNSICGNSAIAAVAPAIGASTDDIASSISFTAVLGVVVVLGLPLLIPLLSLSETQYGILAGMTVYAVPQVLAATIPAGLVATQVGTLVKLVRVMMLGPVPWFIVAFFLLAALRSLALIPDGAIVPLKKLASILTVLSMAALGLGVDLRIIGEVGGRVTAAVTLSLLFLLGLSLGFVSYGAPGL
jgi:uncharacterized membrane protein YadS